MLLLWEANKHRLRPAGPRRTQQGLRRLCLSLCANRQRDPDPARSPGAPHDADGSTTIPGPVTSEVHRREQGWEPQLCPKLRCSSTLSQPPPLQGRGKWCLQGHLCHLPGSHPQEPCCVTSLGCKRPGKGVLTMLQTPATCWWAAIARLLWLWPSVRDRVRG